MAPCEGIFADVKKLPPADIKKENTDMFIERYKNYKKFFEPSEGTHSSADFTFITIEQ